MKTSTEPTQQEIDRVVMQLRVRKTVREKSGPHVIADCPCCAKEGHLYVNTVTGMWDCKRCSESGGLWTLATALGIRLRDRQMVRSTTSVVLGSNSALARIKKATESIAIDKVNAQHARLFDENDEDGKAVRAYLQTRGIADETAERFKLCVMSIGKGDGEREPAVGIPYIDGDVCSLIKMRNLEHDKDKRKFRRTKGGHSGMFNAAGIRGAKRVVLVEGEMDAISLWQLGVTAVASTSLGAQKSGIPQEWLEDLVDADDVVLWYDEDQAGQDGMVALLQQIGTHRCRIASVPASVADAVLEKTGKKPKDANDLLCAGIQPETIKGIINAALGIENTTVVTAGAYGDYLSAAIEKTGEEALGAPTPWDNLNGLLRGVRTREVTIVTGHTGSGKTTWLNAWGMGMAASGCPTLICGLEDGPQTIASMVFQTKFGRPLSSIKSDEDKARAHEVIASMDEHPLYLMDLYGRQPLEVLTDAICYARRRLGVKFHVLDHLGFIRKDPRADSVEHIENVIATLVELSRKEDVHIALIVHPSSKVDDGVIPNGDCLKGASALKQDADNGITVFRIDDLAGRDVRMKRRLKDSSGQSLEIELTTRNVVVRVWKSRHKESSRGLCVFDFDRRSLQYKPKETEQHEEDNKQPDIKADPFLGLPGV